jgi:hypothetical protein
MRKSNTEPLKDALNRWLKAVGAEQKLKELNLLKHWEEVVGRTVGNATEKIFIEKSVLYLKFNSPIVKNEVMMTRSIIAKKMNDLSGEILIREIRVI